MSLLRTLCLALLFAALAPLAPSFAETVQFKAGDGLEVTGEVTKPASGGSTAIVLFHQAGSSRGEYKEIAPRLAKLGYTVLAIDQRSGNRFDGVANETAKRAKNAGKGTAYTDALPDLKAAVAYARDTLGAKKVVLWGSSYSAALAIVIAGTDPKSIDGVLAFSPGEYFKGKPGVVSSAANITVPTFITSAKTEQQQWAGIIKAIPDSTTKTGFTPNGAGVHGSSALIPGRSKAADEYWAAVEAFLTKNFPPQAS